MPIYIILRHSMVDAHIIGIEHIYAKREDAFDRLLYLGSIPGKEFLYSIEERKLLD